MLAMRPRATLYLHELLDAWGDDPTSDARRRGLLSLLLLELAHPQQIADPQPILLTNGPGRELAHSVIEHLRQDLSVGLRMARLCEVTGYSASRLRHLFHQEAGFGLTEAMMQLRLMEAKRLLLHSSLKVASIARMVGFQQAPKFNRFFRERVHCTPRQFAASGSKLGKTWTPPWPELESDEVIIRKSPSK